MARPFARIARRLLRTPSFTGIALLTLALGIGANAAMFSVINGVILKPLPFAAPEQLVGVWHFAPGLGPGDMNQSPATYFTYRDAGRTFEDIGLWATDEVAVTGMDTPERVDALLVTDGVLPVLRVPAALGRRFSAADDQPSAPGTVMLSHGYWQRRFGGRPDVIGRTLVADAKPYEIIGVLPESFRFLRYKPDLVMPMGFDRAKVFVGNFSYQGLARLKPGVTIEQANADIARLVPTVPDRFPLPKAFTRAMYDAVRIQPNVRPLAVDVVGDVDRMLWVLLGTVGLVLLIACANVANLFLVRAEGRQREMAVRAALGASRANLATELLSESVTLGVAGGVIGLGLGYAGIRVLKVIGPEMLPRLDDIALDPLVVAFTIVLSVVSGLLFGLLPVVKYAVPRIAPALVDGGRSVSDGRQRHAARHALVVSQIALALVLLVGSGLMIRTFLAMQNVAPGFVRPAEVLTVRIAIPDALVKDPTQTARTHQAIRDRLQAIPGVVSVGMSSSVTMDGFHSNDPVFVEGAPNQDDRIPPLRRYKWIAPGWFEAMGNPIVAGRDFTWDDLYNGSSAVIVSEGLARQFWRTPAEAIGKRVRQTPQNPWREIVGVVGDERDNGLAQPAPSVVYWPMLTREFWDNPVFTHRSMAYAIRTDRAASTTLLQEVQRAVWAVNPNLPLSNVRTLQAIAEESMVQTSFMMIMLAIAGGVALVLGLVGIYGVIAYVVAQRTREIGIRMALGAAPVAVGRMFLRQGMLLAALGIAIGVGAAAVATRFMASLLYGVGALDVPTFVAVAASLGAVALTASYLPARRAARVDPVLALKVD